MMSFHFIIPEVDSFISGGNLYNKRLIGALSQIEDLQVHCTSIDKMPAQIGLLEGSVVFVICSACILMGRKIKKNTLLKKDDN